MGVARAGGDAYRAVAVSTLEYMLRDLGQSDGGFWSGEDADSEGEEGRFYVFTADEMRDVLGGEDFVPASLFFGVTAAGNFEGSNVLHQARTIEEVTAATGATAEEVEAALSRARDRLLEVRSARVRPGLDDKGSLRGMVWRCGRWPRRAPFSTSRVICRRRAAPPGSCSTASTATTGGCSARGPPHGSDGGGVPGSLRTTPPLQ